MTKIYIIKNMQSFPIKVKTNKKIPNMIKTGETKIFNETDINIDDINYKASRGWIRVNIKKIKEKIIKPKDPSPVSLEKKVKEENGINKREYK